VPFTPPKPLDPPPEDLRGATLLIVDDERVWRVILETDLRMLGYTVVAAQDGREALSRIEQHRPEVAIIDLMLPEPMDGMSLLAQIRAGSNTMPVIFYTAQTDFAAEAQDPQVIAYVSKAVDRADLYSLIPAAIRRARNRHQS
jgi:DNA-binding response OmpR family regulator